LGGGGDLPAAAGLDSVEPADLGPAANGSRGDAVGGGRLTAADLNRAGHQHPLTATVLRLLTPELCRVSDVSPPPTVPQHSSGTIFYMTDETPPQPPLARLNQAPARYRQTEDAHEQPPQEVITAALDAL